MLIEEIFPKIYNMHDLFLQQQKNLFYILFHKKIGTLYFHHIILN